MPYIGKNIANARKALGMTQEELATKMGYRSKSTINKIEMGVNDIAQCKVIQFAEILGTTPANLMGCEEVVFKDNKNFFVIFEYLCKNKGKSTTAICSELGIPKTTVSYWRNKPDTIPKQEVLLKISEYFNVSIDFLLGKEERSNNNSLSPAKKELVELFDLLSKEKQKMFLQMLRAVVDNQQ